MGGPWPICPMSTSEGSPSYSMVRKAEDLAIKLIHVSVKKLKDDVNSIKASVDRDREED